MFRWDREHPDQRPLHPRTATLFFLLMLGAAAFLVIVVFLWGNVEPPGILATEITLGPLGLVFLLFSAGLIAYNILNKLGTKFGFIVIVIIVVATAIGVSTLL